MATGSGKTKVMSLAVVWSYFNALWETKLGTSKNFLLIAPNVIVYQRLAEDFADARIFRDDPLIPPEWQADWQFSVNLRDDPGSPSTAGALFLTNVQQLYESRDRAKADEPAAIAAVMPPKPRGELGASADLRDRILDRGSFFVLNDEAHHLHSDQLEWSKLIESFHERLGAAGHGGLAGQLDFTATPKHTDGRLFREIVVDYPIAQAVDDGIVKTPLIGELTGDIEYESDDAAVRHRDKINAGIQKWQEFTAALAPAKRKPVLFIMAENTTASDQIHDYLQTLPAFQGRVLNIHTNARGEVVEGVSKAKREEIDLLRTAAREVDSPDNPYAAITSVLMLREGWDVQNVVVIVPLRAYTAKANILPEQTLGRGLRRMNPVAVSRDQERVIVIEHRAFKDFWKRELEEEGLTIDWVPVNEIKAAPQTVVVDPTKLKYDIEIPVLTPALVRNAKRLDALDIDDLELQRAALPDAGRIAEEKIGYKGRHMFTGVVVEEQELDREFPADPSGYLSLLIQLIQKETRLTGQFAALAPKVKQAIETKLFQREASMAEEVVMLTLNRPDLKKALFEAFVRAINELSIEEVEVSATSQSIKASDTNAYATTRGCLEGGKTVFNLTPYDNTLERDFASFLEESEDVQAYFKNETATHFEIEYQGVAGGLRNYRPDFIVRTPGERMFIVETKGQEDLEVARKDMRAARWCADASAMSGKQWAYLKVRDVDFRAYPVKDFAALERLLDT
ncbi:MAG: DEAD/DEAH box helicase family protein [Dehalococcoidia bacterium]